MPHWPEAQAMEPRPHCLADGEPLCLGMECQRRLPSSGT